uniref:Uncharacterized protein n=1 Tax=Tanacetum cinerariifolium TaxID=118510 RepID=A0A6L2J7H2_TANCI|nr:hypothetical protein [Tanacetum cinerariifolium]
MMDIGTLCWETISFMYNLVRVSILSVAWVGMKCADLATNRVSLDPDTSCQNLVVVVAVGGVPYVLKISFMVIVDLTDDEDPTDEDRDIGMGNLTGVLVSLGCGISQESNIGDSDNTGDGGIIVGDGISDSLA